MGNNAARRVCFQRKMGKKEHFYASRWHGKGHGIPVLRGIMGEATRIQPITIFISSE